MRIAAIVVPLSLVACAPTQAQARNIPETMRATMEITRKPI
jgi:hypothetical protein